MAVVSKAERAALTSGGANGRNPADSFATAHQRGVATAVLALGMLAERAVATGDATVGLQICELLLPVVTAVEPAESLPPGYVRPAQAAYWVSEGAAFALLKLCSDAGSGKGAQGAAVRPTMSAQHSDARFSFGFCLLAIRRAAAGGGGAVGAVVLPRLRACEPRLRELYAEATTPRPSQTPEPRV